jgi:hypothetical protein
MRIGYDTQMKRQALAAALLAFLAGPPLAADPGRSKAVFTCGTDSEAARRTEGRIETWNLSVFTFTPDSRGTRPLLIPYKYITRLEFGPALGHGTDPGPPITPPCPLKRQDRYLSIFYRKELPSDQETANSRAARERARQEREDRKNRKYQMDKNERRQQQERDEAKARERAGEKEQIAVFELGEGVLRSTLRLLEARSGKRITYQDVPSRKAAR